MHHCASFSTSILPMASTFGTLYTRFNVYIKFHANIISCLSPQEYYKNISTYNQICSTIQLQLLSYKYHFVYENKKYG